MKKVLTNEGICDIIASQDIFPSENHFTKEIYIMKKYVSPVAEVIEVETADIVTASKNKPIVGEDNSVTLDDILGGL